jgi:hypothetical protein
VLDEFLETAYVTQTRKQATYEMVGLLSEIPTMELRKLAAGTPMAELYGHLDMGKVAFNECAPDGSDKPATFLDRFKGTPLFEQAMALEEEELQAEMADLQRRQQRRAESASSDSLWDARDQIRMKKRLLELQLVKTESGAAPETPAQGAGAPGDVPAEGVQDNAQGLGGGVAKVGSPRAAAMIQFADALGRELAQTKMAKVAHQARLAAVGTAAGTAMAKIALNLNLGEAGTALKGLASKAVGMAAQKPMLAGAALGAGAGALAGGKDHRLSGALAGGALGAGAGHIAGGGGGALGAQIRGAASQGLQGAKAGWAPKAPGA